MMSTDDDQKALIKEAIKEWLNEKIAEFGWFALKSVGAMAFAAVMYFILVQNGWHK